MNSVFSHIDICMYVLCMVKYLEIIQLEIILISGFEVSFRFFFNLENFRIFTFNEFEELENVIFK